MGHLKLSLLLNMRIVLVKHYIELNSLLHQILICGVSKAAARRLFD